ncbi:porin family protein [Flavobacterium sp. W22_SRS_FK3]|uniref:porin family protein n=1 Tax=Flavobacterium sp. W22_SRS_FK3 TaxID=3240275 RepID=UPI003F907118
MKKVTLIAFVLFIGLASTQAQVSFSPGIRGGLNISNFTNFEPSNSKSDFYVGGFVAIKFNKYFTLQPELNYTRQGSEAIEYIDGGGLIGSRKVNYDLNYLSVGAVAKFHFGGKGFYILGGPSLDIKTDDSFPEYDNNPAGADFALVGGVGYTLPNGLSFEARFKQGFVDVYGYEGLDNDYYYDDVVLNQVFQLGISYTFKVK